VVISLLAALPASAQIMMSGSVLAGGGGRSTSAGGCLQINATLGQPLAGAISGGTFAITTGYWAMVDSRSRDSLFNTGFEECL
jgi:hypothetical protein